MKPATERGETARLFFALWPDERTRSALAAMAREYCAECGGRAVPGANIHLTLAFLGDVPVVRMRELLALASGIAPSPFALAIDHHGYWRHNRIVWAGARQCPLPLRQLAGELAESMRANGFRYDAREYAPHITLVRDARRGPGPAMLVPVVWQVADFVLVRSTPGGGSSAYEIVERWPYEQPRGLSKQKR